MENPEIGSKDFISPGGKTFEFKPRLENSQSNESNAINDKSIGNINEIPAPKSLNKVQCFNESNANADFLSVRSVSLASDNSTQDQAIQVSFDVQKDTLPDIDEPIGHFEGDYDIGRNGNKPATVPSAGFSVTPQTKSMTTNWAIGKCSKANQTHDGECKGYITKSELPDNVDMPHPNLNQSNDNENHNDYHPSSAETDNDTTLNREEDGASTDGHGCEVITESQRPRVRKRMSSTIRKIQETIREQQVKDAGGEDNFNTRGRRLEGPAPSSRSTTPQAMAVKTVRDARRQRSRSRTKRGKKACDQMQRPYRRWLGVSTCVASDTRYIVEADQKAALSQASATIKIDSAVPETDETETQKRKRDGNTQTESDDAVVFAHATADKEYSMPLANVAISCQTIDVTSESMNVDILIIENQVKDSKDSLSSLTKYSKKKSDRHIRFENDPVKMFSSESNAGVPRLKDSVMQTEPEPSGSENHGEQNDTAPESFKLESTEDSCEERSFGENSEQQNQENIEINDNDKSCDKENLQLQDKSTETIICAESPLINLDVDCGHDGLLDDLVEVIEDSSTKTTEEKQTQCAALEYETFKSSKNEIELIGNRAEKSELTNISVYKSKEVDMKSFVESSLVADTEKQESIPFMEEPILQENDISPAEPVATHPVVLQNSSTAFQKNDVALSKSQSTNSEDVCEPDPMPSTSRAIPKEFAKRRSLLRNASGRDQKLVHPDGVPAIKKKSTFKSFLTMLRGSQEKAEYINVKATKDCDEKLPGLLNFKKGKIIKQLKTGGPTAEGWLYGYYRVGKLRKKVFGLYPSTHVTASLLDEDENNPP